MKILIDMNLSPQWVDVFAGHGWQAVHWSQVGDPRAADHVLMAWAREHGHIVFTHDLDFSALLATTRASGPSVIQVRAQDVTPGHLEPIIIPALRQFAEQLQQGALILVEETRTRARILPLK